MKRLIIYSIILCFLLTSGVFADNTTSTKEKAPKIQSTEGYEVTESETKNIARTKADDKESKQKTKNRKKLIKKISKIEKFENKKRLKERDKDFFEIRLSKKKYRLEEINQKIELNNKSKGNEDTTSEKNSEEIIEKGEK